MGSQPDDHLGTGTHAVTIAHGRMVLDAEQIPRGRRGKVFLDAYGNPPGATAFGQAVIDVFTEARDLMISKHNDYGPTNISNAPGGPINGLRVRIHDKTARINHLVDSGQEPEHEALRDSFMDLANYALIAIMVIDGRWDGAKR